MRNMTKMMIRDTFMRRLNEEPLSKITVRTLCEECGINHNTFYYYYADIYAIIQEYFEEQLSEVEKVYSETDSWEEAFIRAVQPALENRRALYHIYYSVRREDLENFIYTAGRDIMVHFVHSRSPEVPAKEEDRGLIAEFFCCALTELLLRWIGGGMKEPPEEIIRRIGFLMNGSIEEALRRSAEEGKE